MKFNLIYGNEPVLYSKSNELQMEMKEITNEIFNLELDILQRLREE